MKTSPYTERASLYDNLEKMSTGELLRAINQEDQKIAEAVRLVIPKIEQFMEAILPRFQEGGRLFYMGAGTSGRLGILDASEIPPTYGMPSDRVVGLIAGGDAAIRNALEKAEDIPEMGQKDLQDHNLQESDTVVGIAASGTTPYVLGAVAYAKKVGAITAGITNNPGSPLALAADHPLEIVVGPEFVTGSTRMKSGTSQKLVLNMISTTLMIRTGRVLGNKMVNMQLNNNKLMERGKRFLMEELGVSAEEGEQLLVAHGSVHKAIHAFRQKK